MGIGGIGMSAIAHILSEKGFRVSGCDSDCTQKSVEKLKVLGCTISEGNNSVSCNDKTIDILVRSTAISNANPEILKAQERGVPIIHRSEMLAELMRTQYSIGVTGSHGKTTTSSLLAHILLEAQLDPTVIVGGHIATIDNNAHYGKGPFLVAEADESDRSLLNLPICHGVLTGIDLEHLETYKDIDDVVTTFKTFLEKIPFYGTAFVCADDKNSRTLIPQLKNKISYGIHESSDWQINNVTLNADDSFFYLKHSTTIYGQFTLSLPGIHNVKNATAALIVAHTLGVSFEVIKAALSSFKGVDRRFTYKGTYNGAQVFDDYGHHPEELFYSFKVARKKTKGKLWVLFQPHRFSRTQALWNEFIEVLTSSDIDELILTDIYPASEEPREGITSQKLLKDIQEKAPHLRASYQVIDTDFKTLEAYLKQELQSGDLLLLQGAGKVNKIAPKLTLS